MDAVHIEHVCYSYPKANNNIVDDWSASFAAGELTAVTGRSGSGKSTRLFILGLLLKPLSGRLFINGESGLLDDTSQSLLRAREIGFVFQNAELDASRSILDNITEPLLYLGASRSESSVRAKSLLEQFGVDIPLARRSGNLSGGQAQRVALCRALINRPAVVLADEPTGNLDPESARIVQEGLRRYAHNGGCVIAVTHDPRPEEWADRVYPLEEASTHATA